eukprot:scaffold168023_cov39-Tisochrysis_lutea.AAC.3
MRASVRVQLPLIPWPLIASAVSVVRSEEDGCAHVEGGVEQRPAAFHWNHNEDVSIHRSAATATHFPCFAARSIHVRVRVLQSSSGPLRAEVGHSAREHIGIDCVMAERSN